MTRPDHNPSDHDQQDPNRTPRSALTCQPRSTAVDVAWLLIRRHPKYMHVRKLHVLLYFTQIERLERYGRGAFDDPIIAAAAGPTVPAVCRATAFPHDALSVHLNRHGGLHEKENRNTPDTNTPGQATP